MPVICVSQTCVQIAAKKLQVKKLTQCDLPCNTGDIVPLQTFVQFANGTDVVLHETVGPVHTLQGIPVANRNIYLVSLCSLKSALERDFNRHSKAPNTLRPLQYSYLACSLQLHIKLACIVSLACCDCCTSADLIVTCSTICMQP